MISLRKLRFRRHRSINEVVKENLDLDLEKKKKGKKVAESKRGLDLGFFFFNFDVKEKKSLHLWKRETYLKNGDGDATSGKQSTTSPYYTYTPYTHASCLNSYISNSTRRENGERRWTCDERCDDYFVARGINKLSPSPLPSVQTPDDSPKNSTF